MYFEQMSRSITSGRSSGSGTMPTTFGRGILMGDNLLDSHLFLPGGGGEGGGMGIGRRLGRILWLVQVSLSLRSVTSCRSSGSGMTPATFGRGTQVGDNFFRLSSFSFLGGGGGWERVRGKVGIWYKRPGQSLFAGAVGVVCCLLHSGEESMQVGDCVLDDLLFFLTH